MCFYLRNSEFTIHRSRAVIRFCTHMPAVTAGCKS